MRVQSLPLSLSTTQMTVNVVAVIRALGVDDQRLRNWIRGLPLDDNQKTDMRFFLENVGNRNLSNNEEVRYIIGKVKLLAMGTQGRKSLRKICTTRCGR